MIASGSDLVLSLIGGGYVALITTAVIGGRRGRRATDDNDSLRRLRHELGRHE